MKRVKYFILALVCCVLFWSIPVQVEAAYGTIIKLNEVYFFANSPMSTDLQIINVSQNPYVDNNNTGKIVVTYQGTSNHILWVNNLFETYIYDGNFKIPFNFTISNYYDLFESSDINFSLSAIDDFENIYFYPYLSNNSLDNGSGNLYVDLDYLTPYVSSGGGSYIFDFDITYTVSCVYANDIDYPSYLTLDFEYDTSSTTHSIYRYSDYRDITNYDGFIADQNQQIIDGIDENTGAIEDLINNLGNWFTEQKNNINTRFSELTSNLSSWFSGVQTTLSNFFTPYFDNITEAFKKALSDTQATDNEVLSGAMDDYQSAEEEVFNPAMDSLSEFDFGSNDINSLGTGFVAAITFLSSCMSNLYSLTPFAAVFDVIATLGLASICIGLSRLWFGKKG